MAIIRDSQSTARRNQFAADFHLAAKTWPKLHDHDHTDDLPDVHDALGNVPAGILAMGVVRESAKHAALCLWRYHFRLYAVDYPDSNPGIAEENRPRFLRGRITVNSISGECIPQVG